jgi:hypothetical protein
LTRRAGGRYTGYQEVAMAEKKPRGRPKANALRRRIAAEQSPAPAPRGATPAAAPEGPAPDESPLHYIHRREREIARKKRKP